MFGFAPFSIRVCGNFYLTGETKLLKDCETRIKEDTAARRLASDEEFRSKQSVLYNMMNQEEVTIVIIFV